MERVIAIGDRGTAFTDLHKDQLSLIRINGRNEYFPMGVRSDEQLERRNRNEHTGHLWTDARFYVSKKGGQGFVWLGTVEEALRQKLVWKATIGVHDKLGSDNFVGYLRTDYDGVLPHGKNHKFIAVETPHGRVESDKVPRESGEGVRNSPVIRKVVAITRIS